MSTHANTTTVQYKKISWIKYVGGGRNLCATGCVSSLTPVSCTAKKIPTPRSYNNNCCYAVWTTSRPLPLVTRGGKYNVLTATIGRSLHSCYGIVEAPPSLAQHLNNITSKVLLYIIIITISNITIIILIL